MEEYNLQLSENANSRGDGGGGFLYGGGSILVPSSSMYARTSSGFPGDRYDDQGDGGRHHHAAAVKTETGTSVSHAPRFQYPSIIRSHENLEAHHHHHHHEYDGIKAKIVAHPQYSNLLEAYMECQKVGAPPEVVARLTAVREEFEARPRAAPGDEYPNDPELDQFMEAYYDMLMKYREELSRPLQEAMDFMRRIESQLNLPILNSEDKSECIASSEEERDNSGGETGVPEIDPQAGDRELKNHLLKKYSGCLSSLKQELSKKKKKAKLPKEALHKLFNWWELHYKWPYPSESEKVALAESTGLDQKQINNWFINQRKRHWKPSEEVQFTVMDAPNAALYMDRRHYMADGPYRSGP